MITEPRTLDTVLPRELESFLERLVDVEIGSTCNQYHEWIPGLDAGPSAPAQRLANLRAHLADRAGGCGLLLVGEAPGHLGCRFSGIAFTAERQLPPERRTSTHPAGYSEASATIVTRVLAELGLDAGTVRWNAVPTHPHQPGQPRSNRTPTAGEIEQGRMLLAELVDALAPARVVAVGRIASGLLPGVPYVRHPARGGATAFRQGLTELTRD
jgi:uracil-DNA glycosylase